MAFCSAKYFLYLRAINICLKTMAKHFLALAALCIVLASCGSKLGTLSSDDFTLTPQPLEAKGGKVAFAVNGRFPEKFFKKNAEISLIPVLRYDGGETTAKGASFKGENVVGKAKQISYIVGGSFNLRGTFEPWVPEMEQGEVLMRFAAKVGGKQQYLPDVKLSFGVLATATRLRETIGTEAAAWAEDNLKDQTTQAAGQGNNSAPLSADEMLSRAAQCKGFNEREGLYVAAATQYPDDYRAYNNLFVMSWQKGDMDLARIYLDEALQKAPEAAEPNANKALMLMLDGMAGKKGEKLTDEVERCLAKATEAKSYMQVLGTWHIAKGEYSEAAKLLAETHSNTAALAQLLNKDYLKAAETLSRVANPNAETFYLRAVIAARTAQAEYVFSNLRSAVRLDKSIKLRARRDMELSKYQGAQEFMEIVED